MANADPQPQNAAPERDMMDTALGPVMWAFFSVATLGNTLLHTVAGFGRFVGFFAHTIAEIRHFKGWMRSDRLGRQLYFVGTTSVPVLALTGGFIGMTLAFEGYRQFQSIGQEGRLGGVINLSIVKQIGPVLAAVMLAGRVGCALTAELGSMRVTEQLDAMKAMGSDPVRVLVVPRLVACIVMIPALTVVSNLFGVWGGYMITVKFYGADPTLWAKYTQMFISWFDILSGLVKAIFFGAGIGIISCWKGFSCKPGAEGVGEATTESFVTSFIAIIVMGLVLAKVLNDVDYVISGGVQSVFR